jgi:hypothetical protein
MTTLAQISTPLFSPHNKNFIWLSLRSSYILLPCPAVIMCEAWRDGQLIKAEKRKGERRALRFLLTYAKVILKTFTFLPIKGE